MIDPMTIPVLIKAIDFLFGEPQKILQDQQERWQTQHWAYFEESTDLSTTNNRLTHSIVATGTIRKKDALITKESLLMQKIADSKWLSKEAEVSHIVTLMEIYIRKYYIAKEKYAKWGAALVPQVIVYELDDAENGIAKTVKKLRDILGAIYDKEIIIPGIDNRL